MVHGPANALGVAVRARHRGIREYLDVLTIVMFKQRSQKQDVAVLTEVRRYVSDAKAAFGIGVVRVRKRSGEQPGEMVITPSDGLGDDPGGVLARLETERVDEMTVGQGITRTTRDCLPERFDGFIDSALGSERNPHSIVSVSERGVDLYGAGPGFQCLVETFESLERLRRLLVRIEKRWLECGGTAKAFGGLAQALLRLKHQSARVVGLGHLRLKPDGAIQVLDGLRSVAESAVRLAHIREQDRIFGRAGQPPAKHLDGIVIAFLLKQNRA